jgi:hypothetical protein
MQSQIHVSSIGRPPPWFVTEVRFQVPIVNGLTFSQQVLTQVHEVTIRIHITFLLFDRRAP